MQPSAQRACNRLTVPNAANASPPTTTDSQTRPQDPNERNAQLVAEIQEITNTLATKFMLLLPVTVGTKRIGMIYADVDDPAKLRFALQELSLLKTLRNQAVLAVRQSS